MSFYPTNQLSAITRLVVSLATVFTLTLASAGTAAAQSDSNTTEFVAAVSQPGIVFVESTVLVWIGHDDSYLNDGYALPVTTGCTGFIAGANGYIVTAAHCLDHLGVEEEALRDLVALNSGTWEWPDGTVLTDSELYDYGAANFWFEGDGADDEFVTDVLVYLSDEAGGGSWPARIIDQSPFEGGTDVALIKIESTDLPVLPIDLGEVRVGESVVAIGYPGSTDAVTDIQSAPSFTQGSVSSVRTRYDGLVPVVEINASLTFGMSGGPAVNRDGEVIGLNSFLSIGEHADLGFVSPASLIQEVLNRNGVDNRLSDSDADYRSALALHFSGDHVAAAEVLESVVEAQPDNDEARRYLKEAREAAADEVADMTGSEQEVADVAPTEGTALRDTVSGDVAAAETNESPQTPATASDPDPQEATASDPEPQVPLLNYLAVGLVCMVVATCATMIVRRQGGTAAAAPTTNPTPPSEVIAS